MPVKYRHTRSAVVVCHSVPTNWAFPEPMHMMGAQCPPNPKEFAWVYSVGRTMFETDRLPAVFVPRCGRCCLLGCWQCGMLHSVFVFKGYRGGGAPPTGWPHTTQPGRAQCCVCHNGQPRDHMLGRVERGYCHAAGCCMDRAIKQCLRQPPC
jgi:hypothetical protein